MLTKIAIKNIETQFRDYLAYLFAISFTIMVYFTFMTMSTNESLEKLTSQSINFSASLKFTGIIILIFAFLFIFYANAFFIRKRQKSIGIYNLLGIKKRQIAWLLFCENMAIGLVSLVIGIVSGLLFAKLFAMALLRAMQIEATTQFVISGSAIIQTIITFLILFLIVTFIDASMVYRLKLVQLLENKPAETFPQQRIRKRTYLGALLSLPLLITGYTAAGQFFRIIESLYEYSNEFSLVFLLGFILGSVCLGTWLFYRCFLVIVLLRIRRRKKLFFKGMRMIAIANLLQGFKRNALLLTMITLLLAGSLATVGGATIIYSFAQSSIDQSSPTDFVADQANIGLIKNEIMQQQKHKITAEVTMPFKVLGGSFYLTTAPSQKPYQVKDALTFISLKEYQAARKIQHNLPALSLSKTTEVAVIGFESAFVQIPTQQNRLIINQDGFPELTVKKIMKDFPLGQDQYIAEAVVINNSLYQKIKADYHYQLTALQITQAKRSGALSQKIETLMSKRNIYQKAVKTNQKATVAGLSHYREVKMSEDNFETVGYYQGRSLYNQRYFIRQDTDLAFGFLMYIATFLGIIFVIATGSMIMLKQFSEAAEEQAQFQLLRKIGLKKLEIQRSVYWQNFFIFAFPVLIGMLHAFFALKMMGSLMPDPDFTLGFYVCGTVIAIYIIFYLLTAKIYTRIIERQS